MIRYFFTMIILLMNLINSAWALPWLQTTNNLKNNPKQPANVHDETQKNQTNFSGVWVGQCDNNPTVDLKIKHDYNQLSISYGFMEEKYVVGEVKTAAFSHASGSENSNTTVNWNKDDTALIFINYDLFINSTGNLNVFFSKVSMMRKEDQMLVNGQHYHTNGDLGDFEQVTISCNYHLK